MLLMFSPHVTTCTINWCWALNVHIIVEAASASLTILRPIQQERIPRYQALHIHFCTKDSHKCVWRTQPRSHTLMTTSWKSREGVSDFCLEKAQTNDLWDSPKHGFAKVPLYQDPSTFPLDVISIWVEFGTMDLDVSSQEKWMVWLFLHSHWDVFLVLFLEDNLCITLLVRAESIEICGEI